jgi:hypothetical protein
MADELVLAGPGEDETLFESSYSADDDSERMFDSAIACLEDALMLPSFRQPIIDFCRANCMAFIPGVEENTFAQHALFEQYEQLTEAKVIGEISARVPGFDLGVFEAMLVLPGRAEAINSDIIDMLMTFGDFEEFKQTMLSYREQVEYEGAASAASGSSSEASGMRGDHAAARVIHHAHARNPLNHRPLQQQCCRRLAQRHCRRRLSQASLQPQLAPPPLQPGQAWAPPSCR